MKANRLLKLQMEIDTMAKARNYRPLSRKDVVKWYPIYEKYLNGFQNPLRELFISGTRIARGFQRVVIGDFGAYVEIAPEDMLIVPEVQPGQEWRLDETYLKQKGFSLKYAWYHFKGFKIYKQLATVKYADYKPGFYYVSVLYFD